MNHFTVHSAAARLNHKELKEGIMKDIKEICGQVRQTAYDIHVNQTCSEVELR